MEKVRAVTNPLTVIAIFAALAEVAAATALPIVDKSIQGIFVWYVMLFPVALVLLFFSTLNWNARVLYAPSDYRDENNFIEIMKARRAHVVAQLQEVTKEISEISDNSPDTQEQHKTPEIDWDSFSVRLQSLKSRLDDIKIDTIYLPVEPSENTSATELDKLVIDAISDGAHTGEEISNLIGIDQAAVARALARLVNIGIVQHHRMGRQKVYSLINHGRK